MALRVEHSVIIECPITSAWAYAMDVARLPEWMGGIIKAEADGPNGLGQRHIQIRKIMGRDLETEYECVLWEPPNRAIFKSVRGPIRIEITELFSTLDGNTLLTMIVDGEPGGYFAVAAPLLINQLKRDFEADFVRLKSILEAM